MNSIKTVALLATILFATGAQAYKPEIGEVVKKLPVIQTGGAPINWNVAGSDAPRIIVFGASWCPPCKDFKNSLPSQLKSFRQQGYEAAVFYIDSDNFEAAEQAATNVQNGFNSEGYVDLAPDPKKINLSVRNPKGIMSWGSFKIYSFPTVFLLDSHNVLVERYQSSRSDVFKDAAAISSGKH